MKCIYQTIRLFVAATLLVTTVNAQVTERQRPAEWKNLVKGGRFLDRFQPMQGQQLTSNCWGVNSVRPRLVDNGIEDATWSYWGGNILKGDNGKFHLFVCGWLESSAKGHATWPQSQVFNAESDHSWGPFVIKDIIGPGHNPEVYRTKEGKYVLYVIHRRYVADYINGPWTQEKLIQDKRDRKIKLDQSNETFARREDGSILMVSRNGNVFISQTGLTPFYCLSDASAYPKVNGRFEDPIVWRDNVQYNLIVNDWYGRIAYYLRSKDGVKWVCDPGEAYMPGIAVHPDGTRENWFKYERMKVLQDEYGRAIQANFAVIDTLKSLDKGRDKHSSKNICIPLNPGVLMEVIDKTVITAKTGQIHVRIKAEKGFNPQTDIDFASLRFGASSEVNFGRGCKMTGTRPDGNDIIVTFDGHGNGITPDEFAPKLIGRYRSGKLLYGYARLPYVDYEEPILSPRAPSFNLNGKDGTCSIVVDNLGQVKSTNSTVKVEILRNGKRMKIASAKLNPLEAYGKASVTVPCKNIFVKGAEETFVVSVSAGSKVYPEFTIKKKVTE